MARDIAELFDEELAQEHPPPLGTIVEDALRQGRRMRRRRTVLAGSGSAAAMIAIVATAVVVLNSTGNDARGTAADSTGVGSVPSATPSPCPSPAPRGNPVTGPAGAPLPTATDPACAAAPQRYDLTVPAAAVPPSGQLTPATPAGTLELLTQLLPKGRTGGYAIGDELKSGLQGLPGSKGILVQIYLERGAGPGMIRFAVTVTAKPTAMTCAAGETCVEVPGGGWIAIGEVAGNCVGGRTVVLHRADGVIVSASISRCLMWDGRTNPPSARALTDQEAITLVLNPVWGARQPTDIVKAGAGHFPHLPYIQGG
jgi:hypothetical protein